MCIIEDKENFFHFRISKQIVKLLKDHRIFLDNGNMRPSGQIIKVRKQPVAQYTGYYGGDTIFPMGSFSYKWSSLNLNTFIGRYCSIGGHVKIMSSRHPYEYASSSPFSYSSINIFSTFLMDHATEYKLVSNDKGVAHLKTIIEDDVWIGDNVIIAPGIIIGRGSVVATGSIVTKDVKPYSIVGGVPAKIIKFRFSEEIIALLEDSEWWQYEFDVFNGYDIKNQIYLPKKLFLIEKTAKYLKHNNVTLIYILY